MDNLIEFYHWIFMCLLDNFNKKSEVFEHFKFWVYIHMYIKSVLKMPDLV